MSDQDLTLKFQDALAESVSFLDAPQAAGVPQGLLAVQGTSTLVSTLIELATALGKEFRAYLPQLKVAVVAVYDAKIAPLDIPWVPNAMEPLIDSVIRQALDQGLDALIAATQTYTVSQQSTTAKIAEIRQSIAA